jgi:hypothetical protein
MSKIEEAKAILRDAGYFVDNLWMTIDVTDRYECDAETAQEILDSALTHPYIVERIFEVINERAEELELKEKED